jgi:hypothetical protein
MSNELSPIFVVALAFGAVLLSGLVTIGIVASLHLG